MQKYNTQVGNVSINLNRTEDIPKSCHLEKKKKPADYFSIFFPFFALLARADSAAQGRAFLHGSCPVQSTGNVTVAQS